MTSRSGDFNAPTLIGCELEYVAQVLRGAATQAGNGPFTQRAQAALTTILGGARTLLTTSCTAALEMAMLLADLRPGDEVVMPSYTFASTANAVVLRGAVPVFVDVRPDTLNLDEALVERAVTPRTRAICVVHYAGVACEMDEIAAIAARHGLLVVEDAAQGLFATYRGRPLGTLGALSAFSFHETKNIIAGEGGAIVVNDPALVDRAEIVWEKGTDRVRFKRGSVDKYTWVDVGSSYLPNEMTAAFLLAQLEAGREATERRLALWRRYHELFAPLESEGFLARPRPPAHCGHNGHIYFLLAPDAATRAEWLAGFGQAGIMAVTHYVPLHSAPAGRRFGRTAGAGEAPDELAVTNDIAARLLRLPLHLQLTEAEQRGAFEVIAKTCATRPARHSGRIGAAKSGRAPVLGLAPQAASCAQDGGNAPAGDEPDEPRPTARTCAKQAPQTGAKR